MAAIFVDTSFVIALENIRDPYHPVAQDLDRRLTAGGTDYVLHWGIVLEIGDGYARLKRRQRGVQLLDNLYRHDQFKIRSVDSNLFEAAKALYISRPDKEWGLTDCISFVLMERKGIREALTSDPHFRQAGFVPLLLEPEKPA